MSASISLISLILFHFGLVLIWMGLAVTCEVIMEVEFDLHPVQVSSTGYSSGDSISQLLQSQKMKWLRYFNNLEGSKPGSTPSRTAHLAFQDITHWSAFVAENQVSWDALFDLFWVQSRRTLWHSAPKESFTFPKHERPANGSTGYLYQMLYTPFNERAVNEEWIRSVEPFVKLLSNTSDFIQRTHYISHYFQSEYTHLVQYEFSNLTTLSQVMNGKVFNDIRGKMNKLNREYAINILMPGTDGAVYWPAQGADKRDEL